MTPEQQAADAVAAAVVERAGLGASFAGGIGRLAVERISAAELLIVPAGRMAEMLAELAELRKNTAILGTMIRNVRADASADRARVVRYYEQLLKERAA